MIDQKKYNTVRVIIIVIILLLLPAYIIKQAYFTDKTNITEKTPEYVGRNTCIECHEAEYNDWKGSDHDLAMDYATDSTVLGDFNNVSLIRNNQTHKFYKKGNKFFVYTDGEDGKMHEYEVKYVFGYSPLQQYLVEFEGGRLQTLALTWNTIEKNWYYMPDAVYRDEDVDHTNWLHWTNQAQNWNSMCADCHSTNLKKGYDPHTDTYHTTWFEINVSCEACHGPASEHLVWANLPEYARKDIKNTGLVIQTSGIDNIQYVDNCARCHSRRNTLSDFDPHTKNIYNHMIPLLPIEPNYYIDGQIKNEDYVYGSFTHSRMFMNDVKCNDCHNVHSGKLLFEDNALCLQCHKADDYDTKSHTFHKGFGESGEAVISDAGIKFEVGSGTLCINCHMHGQNYMGVDYRRDHSFRIPRPDLSTKNGTPNACIQCHKDSSNQWAQSYIEKWFGTSRPYQFGEAFSAANNGDKNADYRLKRIIKDELYPTSIRSAAINYLSTGFESNNDEVINQSLQNIEPSIRISAIRRLDIISQKVFDKLLLLLYDETKAVRIETAYNLSNLSSGQIPQRYKAAYQKALDEYVAMLQYNSDFPSEKYNLGNFYYKQKNYEKAEKYYLKAIKQDNELNVAKINLAHLYSAMGQPLKAENILEKYILENPGDAGSLYNYGLILSENKKYKKSLEYLIRASKQMPDNSRVDYNIAMLYDFFGDKDNTEKYLKKAIEKDNLNITNYSILLNYYIKNNYIEKAGKLIKAMSVKFPDNEDIKKIQLMLKEQ